MDTDATRWAARFNEFAVRQGYSRMDEGWLIGWFSNAIGAGMGLGAGQGYLEARAAHADLAALQEEYVRVYRAAAEINSALWAERRGFGCPQRTEARLATLSEEVFRGRHKFIELTDMGAAS